VCVCVLFFHSSGTWSDYGLTTTRDTSLNGSNLTVCQSTHLTSFAVLVDVQGAQTQVSTLTLGITYIHIVQQSETLSFISYIGCGISIFSLLLTMLAITFWR